MILSYHPCYTGDTNRLLAGRPPDGEDLEAIRRADAVILPQGVGRSLYEMAAANCGHVFPDYTARFAYPGKIGEIRLFRDISAPHPCTWIFETLSDYRQIVQAGLPEGLRLPFAFKFAWGGEGENVKRIQTTKELDEALLLAETFEQTGQSGFLLQQWIDCGNRSLRVVVIDRKLISYWRIQPDASAWSTSLSRGARIDKNTATDLQASGRKMAEKVSCRTGINLAGFDLLFPKGWNEPLLLETNYFFGRRGLGGSLSYYRILVCEIDNWLSRKGLSRAGRSRKQRGGLHGRI
jgi:ribosomal protein S6--L-glutamate ligase